MKDIFVKSLIILTVLLITALVIISIMSENSVIEKRGNSENQKDVKVRNSFDGKTKTVTTNRDLKKIENINPEVIDQYLQMGLVAYYPFNGNAYDKSGNGNHGTVHGAELTEDRFGNPNSAYYFDGIDDEISLGNSQKYDIRKEITVFLEFKINQENNKFKFSPLIYKGWVKGGKEVYNGWERTYSIWVENTGIIHLSSADDKNAQYLNTPSKTVIPGRWYSFLAVFDRTSGKLKSYLDGILICEGSLRKTSSISSKSPLLIGASMEKYKNFSNFNGFIDNVMIFDRALSENEISNIFNYFK